MKALIAVISSRHPPYGEMIETSKETWDSFDVPGVETVFYVGSPGSPLTDRVIGIPVDESIYSMGHKNLLAWGWMLDTYDFDFMARVNASCYVHKTRLLETCRDHPTVGFLSGGIVNDPNRPPWLWGGQQFVMSRDVVQALVDNPQVWNHGEMEDVALSHAATALGFSFTQGKHACSIDPTPDGRWRVVSNNGESFEFFDWKDVSKLDTQVFFRVKQDLNRHKEAGIMHELKRHLKP